MKKEDMSCIDCAVKNCSKMDKTYPDFCLTTHMDEEVLNEAMDLHTFILPFSTTACAG